MSLPSPSRRSSRAGLLALVALAAPAAAQEVLVAGFNSGVHRYDFATGAFLGLVGSVDDPLGIVTGPDGHVYVAEEATNKVLRFDGETFALLDEFVADDPVTPVDENGPLVGPAGVLFGDDGNLYVTSFSTNAVLRYDGTTGEFLDVFVTPSSGGLSGPDAGIAFGPDGNLYVPSYFNHSVKRYDGETGAFLDNVVGFNEGGLLNPRTVVFRGDGRMLVAGEGSNAIHEYDIDGDFLGVFASYNNAAGLVVSPLDGDVYASNAGASNVRRFNGTTGMKEGVLVTIGSGGLDAAVFVSLHPDPFLRLTRFLPGTTGVQNQIRVSGATPFELVVWTFGADVTSLPLAGCDHLFLGVENPILRLRIADADGLSTLSPTPGADLVGVELAVQALELATCRATNLVVQTFE